MSLLAVGQHSEEVGKLAPNPKALGILPSEAGRALARRLRRVRKKWSGFLHGQRTWRGREIELPDGTPAFLYGALRGQAVWSFDPDRLLGGEGEPFQWGVLPADLIRLRKNPHAQALGAMKRGVRERRSEAKRQAAIKNGRRPCRPGRIRGRPPTYVQMDDERCSAWGHGARPG